MLQPHVLKFLKDLQKNNDRTWFETNRNRYENAKANFLAFVEEVIPAIAKFDPSLSELVGKNCTFRINRDVRFSKNKAPYKNNMSAYFNKAGKKGNGAGYYVHVQPGRCFVAAGIWQPEAADLAKIRQEIDYNFNDWKKILNASTFKKTFVEGVEKNDTLVRPPKGYDDDNPALGFLKLKSFIVSRSFTEEEVMQKDYVKQVAGSFKTVKPVIDFINGALD